MRCPACSAALVAVEYQMVELDCCVACRGTWLDAGELEVLVGDAAECRRLLSAPAAPVSDRGSHSRRCPVCQRPMTSLETLGDKPVAFERCDMHGLWLDHGELEQILMGALAPGGERVNDYLGQVFHNANRRE